jgi:hypothetical protein
MPILGTIASSTRQGLSTNSFFSIATAQPTTGTGTVTFTSSGVWADYTHLYMSWIVRGSRSAPNETLIMYMNSDTTSPYYMGEQVEWDGTNNSNVYPSSGTYTPNTACPGNSLNANFFGSGFAYLYEINNTSKFKPIRADGAFQQDGTGSGYNNYTSTFSTWKNTGALTSITLYPDVGTFITGTHIALYGIKG